MKSRLYILYDMVKEEDTSSMAYLAIDEVVRRNECLRQLNRPERWILIIKPTKTGDVITQYVSGQGASLKPHEFFD